MEKYNCHILEIINKILLLQKQDFDDDIIGCDRPFLGPTPSNAIYNTRPIMIYNKYTALPWSFTNPLVDPNTEYNIFRLEEAEQGSITVRLLSYSTETGQYTSTNQFITIDIDTIGAIRCLPDTYISL